MGISGDGVMFCSMWRQLCLCRLWDVWSVARVRPLAAMSRFIGFNKAKCANNCHQRRGAKPPHLFQTEGPSPSHGEGPLPLQEPIMSPASPLPCWGFCKGPAQRSAGRHTGPRATLLNLTRGAKAQFLSNSSRELSWWAAGGAREHPLWAQF